MSGRRPGRSWVPLLGLTLVTSACLETIPESASRTSAGLAAERADSVWAIADTLVAAGPSAPRILVFGDLQCPSCAALLGELLAIPMSEAPAATLGFIHVPLPAHIRSPVAAAPLACLPDPEARSEYLRQMLRQRSSWLNGLPVSGVVDSVLDEMGYPSCGTANGEDPARQRHQADQEAWAEQLLISWSPTILINRKWLPRESSTPEAVFAQLRAVGGSGSRP